MSYCRDHELAFDRGGCPYCLRGVYPLRDLRAIRDFAGSPRPDTVNVPTWVVPIKYSEVVRRLGRELVRIEADRLSRCADLDLQARELRRAMQRARVSPRELHRAVRVVIGYEEERPLLGELGRSYLEVIEDDGVDW